MKFARKCRDPRYLKWISPMSPTEMIESEPLPGEEQAYVKFSGRGIKKIGYDGSHEKIAYNISDLERMTDLLGREYYTHIHTHPSKVDWLVPVSTDSLSSPKDVRDFIRADYEQTMIVASTQEDSGKVARYFILRKTEDTPIFDWDSSVKRYSPGEDFISWKALDRIVRKFDRNLGAEKTMTAFESLTESMKLNYRMICRSGFELPENLSFLESRGVLKKFLDAKKLAD